MATRASAALGLQFQQAYCEQSPFDLQDEPFQKHLFEVASAFFTAV